MNTKLIFMYLTAVYNARQHPKYKNGEWNEAQCFRAFLDTFDRNNKDGVVSLQFFIFTYLYIYILLFVIA